MEVNSRELRTRRFDTDWVSGDGKYHRALFAGVELCCFPGWLTGDIEKKQFSICDWGCTLGVGTHALQSRFPGSRITGVDFSAPVVEGAKEAYPQIQFVQQELGAASGNARYDVLFSANTLEHFSNPWEVLEGLSGFVNHHLVIQVPYREMVRDEEHLYSFTEGNIPSRIGTSFCLTHMEIIDTCRPDASHDGDLQALLVYSHEAAVAAGRLRIISDSEVRVIETLREQKELSRQLQELKASLEGQHQLPMGASGHNGTLYKEALSAQEEVMRNLRSSLEEKEVYNHRLVAEKAELAGLLEQERAQKEAALQAISVEKDQLAAELAKVRDHLKVRTGINALLEEQLAEKEELIQDLQNNLEEEGEATRRLHRTSHDLQGQVEKLQAELQWYRATYEYRSILGVLKEKFIKSLRGK